MNPLSTKSTWTIHVCPVCGRWSDTASRCDGGSGYPLHDPPVERDAVAVVPAVERDRWRELHSVVVARYDELVDELDGIVSK